MEKERINGVMVGKQQVNGNMVKSMDNAHYFKQMEKKFKFNMKKEKKSIDRN